MITKAIKPVLLSLLAAWAIGSNPAWSEEYMYRDLMGNTLPSQKCLNKDQAEANALDSYLVQKKEKVFCETQGYGWHVAEEKEPGKLVCEECPGEAGKGKFQCHKEDIVVACKRLRPGSVGLIPGKG
jgi:hypothetical protein